MNSDGNDKHLHCPAASLTAGALPSADDDEKRNKSISTIRPINSCESGVEEQKIRDLQLFIAG